MFDLRDHAEGRWVEILSGLNVPPEIIAQQHVACPECGGTDRFRLVNTRRGVWVCNGCRPKGGSPFDLLMMLNGWSFRQAADAVRRQLGVVDPPTSEDRERRAAAARAASLERQAALKEVLRASKGVRGSPVEFYLRGRGLSVLPESDVRFGVARGSGFRGSLPAMLGVIRDERGLIRSVHRTFLQREAGRVVQADVGSAKQVMRPVGTITGGAVRLFPVPAGGVLGVAEGIETALAASELMGVPVWACLSANGVSSFVPPPGVSRLLVFGDRDVNGVGQKAAFELGVRLPELVEVLLPPGVGDWLDELNKRN